MYQAAARAKLDIMESRQQQAVIREEERETR